MLIGAAEIKPRHIRARIHIPVSQFQDIFPAGNFLPDCFIRIKWSALIDISKLDSFANPYYSAIGLFLALETSKFIPMFYEFLGSYAYNYPISQIFTLMRDAGNGGEPNWDAALAGVRVAALYVAGFFSVSIAIFCRRDVTL